MFIEDLPACVVFRAVTVFSRLSCCRASCSTTSCSRIFCSRSCCKARLIRALDAAAALMNSEQACVLINYFNTYHLSQKMSTSGHDFPKVGPVLPPVCDRPSRNLHQVIGPPCGGANQHSCECNKTYICLQLYRYSVISFLLKINLMFENNYHHTQIFYLWF